jgi:hypothetical protein
MGEAPDPGKYTAPLPIFTREIWKFLKGNYSVYQDLNFLVEWPSGGNQGEKPGRKNPEKIPGEKNATPEGFT